MADTTTAPTSRHEATVERYVRFWNAGDPGEQQRLAADTFLDDVEYHAPVGLLRGPGALIEFRDQFAQHMDPVVFRRLRAPEIHHDRARLAWEIEVHGGRPFAAGTDVLEFATDGRIASVSAFVDRAPEGFDPHAHD